MKIVRRAIPENSPPIVGVPDFLSNIYLARGITSHRDLEHVLKALHPPQKMKGMDAAIELLYSALTTQQRILIVGDFDCDGATSTALAVLALKQFGAQFVDYIVPNRFDFGYGLTPEIVEFAHRNNQPDLIITVDNGIASIEGVQRAHSLGIKVLITDHHLPGESLPDAEAIVNPNQHGCGFESKCAAGVGVIFYVMSKLRTFLRERQWFSNQGLIEPNMADYLDLVALGTVADLVPLDRNNRILVSQGLSRIRAGKCRFGIKALLEVAGKLSASVKTSDMGFIVGPRLNAAGRLDDMSIGIECLLANDEVTAARLATKLDQLNVERKQIESEMKLDAETYIEAVLSKVSSENQELPWWGLSLFEPHWHQGVIGILAARIKEKLYRPVIAFAPESEDADCEVLKGSARSIEGLHMRDALDLVAKRDPSLILKFGGHAMAAGLTIRKDDIERFQSVFDKVVRELLDVAQLQAVIMTDGALKEGDCHLSHINLLEHSGPWGQKFPEPCFDNVFEVMASKVLKEKHVKLMLRFKDGLELFDAIQFNSNWAGKQIPRFVRAVYRPNINEFRGRKSVQFMLDYIEPANELG